MGCCSAKQKKVEQAPLSILKKDLPPVKPPVKSFNLEDIYTGNDPRNEIFKKLAESFKQTVSPVKGKTKTKLPGPQSYPVPDI